MPPSPLISAIAALEAHAIAAGPELAGAAMRLAAAAFEEARALEIRLAPAEATAIRIATPAAEAVGTVYLDAQLGPLGPVAAGVLRVGLDAFGRAAAAHLDALAATAPTPPPATPATLHP